MRPDQSQWHEHRAAMLALYRAEERQAVARKDMTAVARIRAMARTLATKRTTGRPRKDTQE